MVKPSSIADLGTPDAYEHALRRLLSVPSSPRFGLERMAELLRRVGDPQLRFVSLHVAGTNGKGSTCAFLDAMLAEQGIARGMTTSPHLSSARERIRIQGELISVADFIALENEVYGAAKAMADPPTFFERMTAMSFMAFAAAGLDVAVVEVGLGGRLDATNLVRPIACGITRLGLDHQMFLGDGLAEIAAEKAGIFKNGIPARSVPQESAAMDVLRQRAARTQTPFREIEDAEWNEIRGVSLQLAGAHQAENAALALSMWRAAGLCTDGSRALRGLQQAFWPGRFEQVVGTKRIWLDGAHNPPAAQALVSALRNDVRTRDKPIFLLIGMTRGHEPTDFANVLRDLPIREVRAVCARAPRSLPVEELVRCLHAADLTASGAHRWQQALAAFTETATREDGIILVTGSLYLVGEVRAHLLGLPEDPHLPEF